VKFTLADGSVRHSLRYFNGTEWVGTWEETTPPNEPVWESGLGSPLREEYAPHNCFWLAIGRTSAEGIIERKIFHKGELTASFSYNADFYETTEWSWLHLPTGQFAACWATYQCPKQLRGEATRYCIWDESGGLVQHCARVRFWCNGWAFSEIEEGGGDYDLKMDTVADGYSYTTIIRKPDTCGTFGIVLRNESTLEAENEQDIQRLR